MLKVLATNKLGLSFSFFGPHLYLIAAQIEIIVKGRSAIAYIHAASEDENFANKIVTMKNPNRDTL